MKKWWTSTWSIKIGFTLKTIKYNNRSLFSTLRLVTIGVLRPLILIGLHYTMRCSLKIPTKHMRRIHQGLLAWNSTRNRRFIVQIKVRDYHPRKLATWPSREARIQGAPRLTTRFSRCPNLKCSQWIINFLKRYLSRTPWLKPRPEIPLIAQCSQLVISRKSMSYNLNTISESWRLS
jgi:hypothetical protein